MTGERLRSAIGVVVLLCVAISGTAQEPADDIGKWVEGQEVDIATLDLSVPESPGFTVLGLTPESVVRPSTPRDLVASLLNGVDANGNLQSGVAVDTNPYMLVRGGDMTLFDYRHRRFLGVPNWLWGSGQLSVATTKGTTDDDEAIRAALGLRMTPINLGDPRRDGALLRCIQTAHGRLHDLLRALNPNPGALQKLLDTFGPEWIEKVPIQDPQLRSALNALDPGLVERLDGFETGALGEVESCLAAARRRNWNATAWELGGAPSFISTSGQTDDLNWNGGALWTSLAIGFPYESEEEMQGDPDAGLRFLRTHSQMIVHARYRVDQENPDPQNDGAFIEGDDFIAGGRVRLGIPRAALSFEAAYVHDDPDGRSADDSCRFAFIGEIKLVKDVWLNLSVGGQGGRRGGENEGFVLSSLKYGFGSESQVDLRTER